MTTYIWTFFSYLFLVLTVQLCTVSVAVGVDAELDESWLDDVRQTEDRIVSQWREISADEKHQLRDRVDEILRPLGLQTRLVVVERANSLALYFICMTLAALMSLRDQWRRQQLRDIVKSLFTFLSGATRTVWVKRLTWPLTDYQRCSEFFRPVQGKQKILSQTVWTKLLMQLMLAMCQIIACKKWDFLIV